MDRTPAIIACKRRLAGLGVAGLGNGGADSWAMAWKATGGLTIRRRLTICPTYRRGGTGGGLGRIWRTSAAIKARNRITSTTCGTTVRQAD
jgi:hypothetical protein